jgi:hypothetical protein
MNPFRLYSVPALSHCLVCLPPSAGAITDQFSRGLSLNRLALEGNPAITNAARWEKVYRKYYAKRGCLVTVDNKISSDSERKSAELDELDDKAKRRWINPCGLGSHESKTTGKQSGGGKEKAQKWRGKEKECPSIAAKWRGVR